MSLYAWTTSLDFAKAFSVPGFLILSTNLELKICIPFGKAERRTGLKTPFLINP